MNVSDQNDPPEWNPFQNDPFQNKDTRKGKGRQKINIEKIRNDSNLQVTFSKRRVGLFKKSSELSTLTGAEIFFLVFSPSGKPYSFVHPDKETIINKFRNQNQNQPRDETNNYLIAERNTSILQNNQKLIQLESRLDHEKKRAKEIVKSTQEILKQGHWSSTLVLALRDNEIVDFYTRIHNLKVSFEDRVKNHQASLMNLTLNPNHYSDSSPNLYLNSYVPGTGTDGINFSWQNPSRTNYFGLPNNNYNIPWSSDLSYNQEGSMFLGELNPSCLLNNMTSNLNESDFMELPGPSGTHIVDLPQPSGTNLMDPTTDPTWEQFSTFSFQGYPSSSNNVTINPVNPYIDNVVAYDLQPANSMVPIMQGNLDNLFQRFNNNYNRDRNLAALNQENVANMFQGFNNVNSENYTMPNQGNVHNMFQGTLNNNNGNENLMMLGQENVQNMFQGLNNNNDFVNSTTSGQSTESQIMFQAFNRKNGRGN